MADTVEALKQKIMDATADLDCITPELMEDILDALIAAVRAEMVCPQCEAHGLPSHLIPR